MAVNSTVVWRIRTGGNNLNGGGYDSGIAGAGTDYSQQDAAQASGTNGTSNASTTFQDTTAAAFTSAMVGNALWLATGTNGITSAPYMITGYTNSTTITLDRNCSTGAMTNGAWKIGGAWADPRTNVNNNGTWIVPGCTVYIRGSGSNNPSTPDYVIGNDIHLYGCLGTSANLSKMIGENGRPFIQGGNGAVTFDSPVFWILKGMKVQCTSTSNPFMLNVSSTQPTYLIDMVFDQNGYDVNVSFCFNGVAIGCEVYSSVAARSTRANPAFISPSNGTMLLQGCNIHDTVGGGVSDQNYSSKTVIGCIFANCGNTGITFTLNNNNLLNNIIGNTFYGNGGSGGIVIPLTVNLNDTVITNNIFMNHNGVSQAGITFSGGGTPATNDLAVGMIRGNAFYNNTSDCSGISLPPGNTTGTDPGFTSPSTENFGPGTALANVISALAGNSLSGKVATVNGGLPGAAQITPTLPTPFGGSCF